SGKSYTQHLVNLLGQVVARKGLLQYWAAAELTAGTAVIRQPRNKQNLDPGPALGNAFGKVEAFTPGIVVGHYEMESAAAPLAHCQRFSSAAGVKDGVSVLPPTLFHHSPQRFFIVHHQDGGRCEVVLVRK